MKAAIRGDYYTIRKVLDGNQVALGVQLYGPGIACSSYSNDIYYYGQEVFATEDYDPCGKPSDAFGRTFDRLTLIVCSACSGAAAALQPLRELGSLPSLHQDISAI